MLDEFEEAQRRMPRMRRACQFEQAVRAINRRLEDDGNADRLFGPNRKTQPTLARTGPDPDDRADQRP